MARRAPKSAPEDKEKEQQTPALQEASDQAERYPIPAKTAAEETYRLLTAIFPEGMVRLLGRSFSYRYTVDAYAFGRNHAALTVRFVSPYGDQYHADDAWLSAITGQERSAIVVLGDGYTQALEDSIRQVAPMAPLAKKSVRLLEQAVLDGRAVICGKVWSQPAATAREKLESLIHILAETALDKLSLIQNPVQSEDTLQDILQGTEALSLFTMAGDTDNREAKEELHQWLQGQFAAGLRPTLPEVLGRFSGIPYGWATLDTAALLARLAADQQITVLAGGTEVPLDSPSLPAILCGRRTAFTAIAPRRELDPELLAECTSFLRRWLDTRDIPKAPDALLSLLRDTLRKRESELQLLLCQYSKGTPYPGKQTVQDAWERISHLLRRRPEQESLLREVAEQQGDLLRDAQATAAISRFFQEQRSLFDGALARTRQMQKEKSFFAADPEVLSALRSASDILALPELSDRLEELPALLDLLQAKYEEQCAHRKAEAKELIRHSMEDIRQLAEEGRDTEAIFRNAEVFFRRLGTDVREADTLTRLDELSARIADKKNLVCRQLESLGFNLPPQPTGGTVRTVRRYDLCSSARLSSKEEIGAYVAQIRAALEQALDGADSIQVL